MNQTEKQERQYLNNIIDKLNQTHNRLSQDINGYEEDIQDGKEYIWENKADLDGAEKAANRMLVHEMISAGEQALSRKRQIERLIDSPYFGRVDFQPENSDQPDACYVGLHTFSEQAGGEILIYDWRAPISSLFYDFEKGPAAYVSPSGRIAGLIDLKRQYKIRQGALDYLIESEINIGDDILQKELSKTSSDKMKNIVVTIQREQNAIIRNASADTLIVQGVAGSGKTSIALHRVAFLLYRHSETLSSDDMMIISPNKVFADYISNVLPELGEDNIQEIDMMEIAEELLDGSIQYQSFSDQVDYLIHEGNQQDLDRIQYKATAAFVAQLQQYLQEITQTGFVAADLSYGSLTITAAAIQESFLLFDGLPIKQRLEQTADDLIIRINRSSEERISAAVSKKVKNAIIRMFPFKDALALYANFYKQSQQNKLFKYKKNHLLLYEDVFPLIYTKLHFEETRNYSKIQHLLVDEMQDYTAIQYAVLRKIFPCKKTILGDSNQSVNPHATTSLELLKTLFPEAEMVKLCKSYRSTLEITQLTQSILKNEELIPIERHGEAPALHLLDTEKEELKQIRKLIKAYRRSNHQSLGIICKTSRQAKKLYDTLAAKETDLIHLDFNSRAYQDGIIITSAHMAKGLEFDQVIVPHVDADTYRTQLDRSLLYIACTRAMHQLDLTCHSRLSALLPSSASA